MKRIYSLLICAFIAVSAFAIPAMKGFRTVKQPDGTELRIQLIGDEFFSYHATADGIPVMETLTGAYVYAKIIDGVTMPTATLAHEEALRQNDEVLLVSELKKQKITPSAETIKIREENNLHTLNRANNYRTQAETAIEGQKNCLIILVQYPDKKMTHTLGEFKDMMTTPNYNKNNHIGSLSDFFYDQSYGKLSVNFDVVGPFTTEHELAYYGKHTKTENDTLAGALISEAVHYAHNAGVNFAKYDWTGNGEVDQVFVIYAGYAEAQGGKPETIWPHKWNLSSAAYFKRGGTGRIKYDGVWIDTYACSSELRYASGNNICGIGTAAHEFSHCLGLPDLYDTDYSGGTGMNTWSLMDSGGYRADGDVPTPYTAQERAYIGWMDLIELDNPMKVTNMPSIVAEPTAYVLYNEGKRSEYYILENHQQQLSGIEFHNWDISAPGHGMLITHVDFDANIWRNNKPNDDPNHQRCFFIPADGNSKTASAGSLYPGSKKNTSLTNTSTPAAVTYYANKDGKKFMNRPIESITEHNGLIDFIFDGGVYVPTPYVLDATDVTKTGFTANWTGVAEAESYILEVTERGDASLLFAEDFTTNEKFDVTADGTEDIGSKLDQYFDNAGWKGTNLFVSPKKLRLGKGATAGSLTSPTFKAPTDGIVKIEVGLIPVTLSTARVAISVMDGNGAVMATDTIKPDSKRHTIEFTDITKNFSIKFATDKNRACIDYIAGYTAPEPPDTSWNSIGIGSYNDCYYFEEEVPCEYFQHKQNKNLFRIPNPYPSILALYDIYPSTDVSDYLYLQLLQKGDSLSDQRIDRNGLVLFYGNYDHSSLNTGYTHPNYGEDLCIVHPCIFTNFSTVESWSKSRVLSYQDNGLPQRAHLAPMYYLWNSGGWNATQEADSVIYLNFPDVKKSAPMMASASSKGSLRSREITDGLQEILLTSEKENFCNPMYAPGQKIVVPGLTETSYTLSNLTENATYVYRVKAVNYEGESKWSDMMDVDLSQGTGINSIPASKLLNGEGEVYDLSGRRVLKLQRGIYIQNGKAVIVK